MRKRKKIIAVLLVLVLAAVAVFAYRAQQQAREQAAAKVLTLSGNVDVREVTLAFRESDRIKELRAEEGDTVRAGDVLGRLDTEELSIQLRKTQAQIAAQESAVAKLKNGTRSEEIAQARENLRAARAAAENAAGVYARRQQVYDEVAGVSEQELENARTEAASKEAAAEAAAQKLAEAEAGARVEDIQAAEATLASLEEEQARLTYLLSQYELKAPADGVVRSRLLEPGDMAGPSTPVYKLSLLGKKWVRAYLKERICRVSTRGRRRRCWSMAMTVPSRGRSAISRIRRSSRRRPCRRTSSGRRSSTRCASMSTTRTMCCVSACRRR